MLVSTSDKAVVNMKMVSMHRTAEDGSVVYKTVNVYAPDRHIFFVSDVPHLMKTFRNNIFKSRENGGKRLLKVPTMWLL